jgi:hypothetical protein
MQLCLLDRRVNKFRLRDTEVELYKRCVTFEGSDHLSASAPMTGPALAVRACDPLLAYGTSMHQACVRHMCELWRRFGSAANIPRRAYKSIAELIYSRSLPAYFLCIPIRCRF